MFKLPENVDLSDVLSGFPGHLYIKDVNGSYLGSNNQYNEFLRKFGFYRLKNSRDILGKTDYDFFSKEEADQLFRNDQRIMRSGERELLEESVVDHEGNTHTYISTKQPLLDQYNNVIGIVGTSVDISEQANRQKHFAEQMISFDEVKQQKTFMDTILWCLPEQFYWLDLEGRVVACNERHANLAGLSREQILGMNIYDVAKMAGWDPEIAELARKNDKHVMETGEPIVVEESADIDGKHRTFLSYKSPLHNKDKELIGVYGVSVDITDRKEIESNLIEQRRIAEVASHAKSQFLMNMSHDIRTPFSGIIGNAEILQRQEDDPEKKQKLRQIIDSSTSLLSLLNDIIDVVQLEDQQSVSLEPCLIADSINKISTIMRVESEQKPIELVVAIDNNVPKVLVTHAKSIERILLNLLGNALKFTHKGSVNVHVNADSIDEDHVMLVIAVKDTGIGIAKDQLEVIFDQFTRLTPAFERHYEGSGLGLWIAKQLLNQLDGTITIDSELNMGTKVTVQIPCRVGDVSALPVVEKMSTVQYVQTHRRILVVEDDPIAGKIAVCVLQDYFDVDVDIAQSGREAILLSQQHQYDFMLMDVGLPDMDGVEAARSIRQESKEHRNTPIIGLTAHANFEFDQNIMTAMLEKPLTFDMCEKLTQILTTVTPKIQEIRE